MYIRINSEFEMGIDVPDIDLVVKLGCSPTLEELVQQFERAGRDGRKAKGIEHKEIHVM